MSQLLDEYLYIAQEFSDKPIHSLQQLLLYRQAYYVTHQSTFSIQGYMTVCHGGCIIGDYYPELVKPAIGDCSQTIADHCLTLRTHTRFNVMKSD